MRLDARAPRFEARPSVKRALRSPRSPAGTSVALAALAVALSSAGWAIGPRAQDAPLAEPRPVDDGVPAAVEGYESMSCARCHAEIAREWAGSRHALAWIDPHYRKALAKMRRPESCHGCHVPEALHSVPEGEAAGTELALPARPAARANRLQQGIDCRACHAAPGEGVLGPWGIETYAHPTQRSASFTAEGASRLCITCHDTHIGPVVGIAKDFVASGQAERGLSCVGCHMAPVERSAAHDPDEDEPSPVRAGRSHALQTPRDPSFLRRAFELRAERRGTATVVIVENRCGHRVPGLAEREIELVASAEGKRGEPIEARFTLTKESYLPIDEPLELRLEAPVAKVSVRGLHHAPGFAKAVEFLALELEPAD